MTITKAKDLILWSQAKAAQKTRWNGTQIQSKFKPPTHLRRSSTTPIAALECLPRLPIEKNIPNRIQKQTKLKPHNELTSVEASRSLVGAHKRLPQLPLFIIIFILFINNILFYTKSVIKKKRVESEPLNT